MFFDLCCLRHTTADEVRIGGWSADVCSSDLDMPIQDMPYKDLASDPVAAVRGIYDRFGWDFTPATGAGVLGWRAENPAGKHGKHKYSLEEFGLNEQAVRDVYADYIETYREYI